MQHEVMRHAELVRKPSLKSRCSIPIWGVPRLESLENHTRIATMKIIFRSAGSLLTKSKELNLNAVAMATTYVIQDY